MRNAGGYVRLYRSMLDWEWYDNDACVRIMLHLLLTVNWEPKKWHGQTVEPGQIITSMEGLSKTLGMTRTSVRRTFDKLKSSGEVTVQTNNHWTLVTLTNWAEYQGDEPNNGRPLSRPLTDQRPTTDRPAATTKEGKNIISEEKSSALVSAARKPSSIEERKADFVAKCKAVVEVDPGKLPDEHRKPFFEYWTETTQDGSKMRFEGEKFFVHSRRMATWMTTANKITSNGGGFKTNSNGAKTYDGWTVEKVEAYLKQFKAENNGRYPNSGDVNIPKAYKLFKEWI